MKLSLLEPLLLFLTLKVVVFQIYAWFLTWVRQQKERMPTSLTWVMISET